MKQERKRAKEGDYIRRGQVSVELLVVIGFILVLFIPLLIMAYFQVVDLNDQLLMLQAQMASSRLANLGNSVARMGEDSSIITDIYIPPHVASVEFRSFESGGEIIFHVITQDGESEVIGVTDFPVELEGNEINKEGLYRFELVSTEGKILIRRI